MHFLRRHQYLLCFLAVLVLSCFMVVRQFVANQSAHIRLREDFILLNDSHRARSAAQLYQVLIQQLPGLGEKALVADLERMSTVVDPRHPASTRNLEWKYYVSVKNELRKRAQSHLARALRQARSQ